MGHSWRWLVVFTTIIFLALVFYYMTHGNTMAAWFAESPDVFAYETVHIGADQTVGKVLVVNGDVIVSGNVKDGIVVIDGSLFIREGASVQDGIVVLGGYIELQSGGRIAKKAVTFPPRSFSFTPLIVGAMLILAAVVLTAAPICIWLAVRIFIRTALYKRLEQLFSQAKWQWTAVYIIASLTISGIMLAFFAEVAWETMFRHTTNVVDSGVIWLVRYFASPLVDKVMLFVTSLGYSLYYGVFIATVLVTLAFCRRFLEAAGLMLCLAGGTVLNILLKYLFERSRPDLYRVVVEVGYSFPSGHAMVSLCFYGMLTFFLLRSVKSDAGRLVVLTGAILLVSAIGISRIYLGVHYPTDILAGYAAGGMWLTMCIALLLWWEKQRIKG